MLSRDLFRFRRLAVVIALLATATTAAQPAGAADEVVYRTNAGGPELTTSPPWQRDTSSSPSPYVNGGATKVVSTGAAIDTSHPSLPGATPGAMFGSERYLHPKSSDDMHWDFPVASGSYEVRLYFAETFDRAQESGARVFDVTIEGQSALDNYDVYQDVGGYKGVMKSFDVVSNANLDIDFGRVVQNPMVKGIEILSTGGDSSPPPPPPPPACSDGIDNDGDSAVDYPADPGCSSAQDDDETNSSTPPPSGSKTLAAAGDIVCSPAYQYYNGGNANYCQHRKTADLLTGSDGVIVPGDHQYNSGTLNEFKTAYDPTWGRFASKTYPAPGNHEYRDPAGGAKGYFDYWASKSRPTGGRGRGYYSFDLGAWHIVSLNSSDGKSNACQTGPSCAEGSEQNNWLEQDLKATNKNCVLAYWHHPLYNSGTDHGNDNTSAVRDFWTDLYAEKAEIIVNGHEHNYQRYAPLTPSGSKSADGIREFLVGTGGKNRDGLLSGKDSGFEFGITNKFGILKLELEVDRYSWKFVDTSGAILDKGGPVACH